MILEAYLFITTVTYMGWSWSFHDLKYSNPFVIDRLLWQPRNRPVTIPKRFQPYRDKVYTTLERF